MDCTCSTMENYLEIYFTQLFTTLGQVTAAVMSGAVAVPVASYYYQRYLSRYF